MKSDIVINKGIDYVFNFMKDSIIKDAKNNGNNTFVIKKGSEYTKRLLNSSKKVKVIISIYNSPNSIGSIMECDARKYSMNYYLQSNEDGKTKLIYEEIVYENDKEIRGIISSFAYLLKRKTLKKQLESLKINIEGN